MAITLGEPDNPIISVDGATLSVLEQIQSDDGARRWQTTTRWVHPNQSLAIVSITNRMIASLWEAARALPPAQRPQAHLHLWRNVDRKVTHTPSEARR